MDPEEGYVRYHNKGEDHWTGQISEPLLTPRRIQIMRFQGYEFEKDYSSIPNLEIPKPPKKLPRGITKKSQMSEDITYVLCPDRTCGLFWEKDFFACEGHCPRKSEEKLVVICKDCNNLLVLPANHSAMQRLDHKCQGIGCRFRLRSSSHNQLIYKLPKD